MDLWIAQKVRFGGCEFVDLELTVIDKVEGEDCKNSLEVGQILHFQDRLI